MGWSPTSNCSFPFRLFTLVLFIQFRCEFIVQFFFKEDWEYEPVLVKDAEANNITVKFQQVPPEHIREEIFSQAAEMFGPDKTDKDKETETKEKEKESDLQPTSEDSTNQE